MTRPMDARQPVVARSSFAEVAMSSIDLLVLVNKARADFGESAVRHADFAARCRDELDGEHYETFVVQNLNNTTTDALRMTADQCKLVAMRESKAVRRAVLARLNELEAQRAPRELSRMDLIMLAMDSEKARLAAEAERDLAIATKAQIGSRREATAMATASAAAKKARQLEQEMGRGTQHATITAVENATGRKFGAQGFRPLKAWCKRLDVIAPKVNCPRYGEVRSWPAMAWMDVYGIDLGELFGAEVVA